MAIVTSDPSSEVEHPWLHDHRPFGGKYTVERIIGQGGMGVVFEARHIRVGQRVAIKVLGSSLREYPELVQRFEREARVCGALSSIHAVRVFDIDATEDGTPFIVMELLSGRDLSTIVDRDGPQPVPRATSWIIEACDAIAEAHREGIIHRDIKPSNLFLSDVDGRKIVKVLDFGIAKRVSKQEVAITQAIAPLGTPQYMSPEQVRCAKDVDARTDVWSLGVTLYEMVCGQTPFAHDSASACIASIAADPVPDPRLFQADLPDAFVAVLMRALEKNANDRYQSVAELVAALAPFAATDDDEEMVSAVRRALLLTPRVGRASAVPTLGGAGDVVAESADESLPPARPAHEPAASLIDRSVAPATAPVLPPVKRRFRASIGLLTAAALGVTMFVLTPRCVGTSAADATPSQMRLASNAAAQPASSAAVAVPTAAREPTAPEPTADVIAPPPATAVAAPVAPAPSQVARVVRAKLDKPALLPAPSARGVHGGLSSPGF